MGVAHRKLTASSYLQVRDLKRSAEFGSELNCTLNSAGAVSDLATAASGGSTALCPAAQVPQQMLLEFQIYRYRRPSASKASASRCRRRATLRVAKAARSRRSRQGPLSGSRSPRRNSAPVYSQPPKGLTLISAKLHSTSRSAHLICSTSSAHSTSRSAHLRCGKAWTA